MSKKQLGRYCPKCHRLDHHKEAFFCLICGTELVNGSLRTYYLNMKIPDHKIDLEQNDPYTFTGFPFFLRKIDLAENLLQAITLHEYPNGKRVFVRLPAKISVWSENIVVTDFIINELLSQGFEWFHHSEMDTLWCNPK